MPITVDWDDAARTTLRWDIVGTWTWEMIYTATRESVLKRRTVAHSVAVIINMERAALIPPGALTHTRNALMVSPDDRDLVVVVGRSSYTQAIVAIFRKMYITMSEQIVGVESLDKARRLIASRRAEVG